jgi:hypothetical protein
MLYFWVTFSNRHKKVCPSLRSALQLVFTTAGRSDAQRQENAVQLSHRHLRLRRHLQDGGPEEEVHRTDQEEGGQEQGAHAPLGRSRLDGLRRAHEGGAVKRPGDRDPHRQRLHEEGRVGSSKRVPGIHRTQSQG